MLNPTATAQSTEGPLAPPTFRAAIEARVREFPELLRAPAGQLLLVPGKGIRPACVRLVAEAFSPDGQASERHGLLAEALELLHVGTLVHDDILDEAATRRGVPTVHSSHGAKVAVLAGDVLLAQASMRLSLLDDPYLMRRMGETIVALCEGELRQDEQRHDLGVDAASYLDRVALKTASPFELACEGSARLSGASAEACANARRFGFHLGRLFQLVDDWLDWAGQAEALGKPVGQDLLAGSFTLPVLCALADEEVGPRLRAKLRPFPEAVDAELRALVGHPSAMRATRAFVQAEAEAAREALATFPEGAATRDMGEMLERLLVPVLEAA